jgi:hypothetical protein
MDDVVWEKDIRVSFEEKDGTVYTGTVEIQRRGWVTIELDEPCDTAQGWKASKMMVKSSDLKLAS